MENPGDGVGVVGHLEDAHAAAALAAEGHVDSEDPAEELGPPKRKVTPKERSATG